MQPDLNSPSLSGMLVALVIIVLWVSSLAFLLLMDADQLPLPWILLAILGRTYIQTGLFIVVHDAIHGAVLPRNRRCNNGIGQLCLTLYALLSYKKLFRNHWQHHRHPGQRNDPDFHDGNHRHIALWYWKFMQEYLDAKERTVLLFKIIIIFLIFKFGFHIPTISLFLFWFLPIVLSSMQLFFFGTYLPHRSENLENSHHAVSSNYPLILSFLTCYHFGYHWEHHEYPNLPWYKLPSVRQVQ
ncbi:MAG: fatty acid desaturase [Elainellaceae cyanobacterium]